MSDRDHDFGRNEQNRAFAHSPVTDKPHGVSSSFRPAIHPIQRFKPTQEDIDMSIEISFTLIDRAHGHHSGTSGDRR